MLSTRDGNGRGREVQEHRAPRQLEGKLQEQELTEQEQAELEKLLGEGLRQFDHTFQKQAPSLESLTGFVTTTRKESKRKLWRDLTLLWVIGCVAAGGASLLLASGNMVSFVVIQLLALAGGLLGMLKLLPDMRKRELERQWTK